MKSVRELTKLLEGCSLEQLDSHIVNQRYWFSDDPDVVDLAVAALTERTKEAKIKFLMSADPIAAEGGLLDWAVDRGLLSARKEPAQDDTPSLDDSFHRHEMYVDD